MFREKISENLENHSNLERLQINPNTGISQDFFNKYNGFISAFKEGGVDGLRGLLKDVQSVETEIPAYEDFCAGYPGAINNENRKKVQEIDELVYRLNEMIRSPETIEGEEFAGICNRLNFIIYGKEDGHRDIKVKKLAEAA